MRHAEPGNCILVGTLCFYTVFSKSRHWMDAPALCNPRLWRANCESTLAQERQRRRRRLRPRSREARRARAPALPWEGERRMREQPGPSKKLQSLVATSRNTLGWRAIILSNVTAAPEG
jgi:hypothetical protein